MPKKTSSGEVIQDTLELRQLYEKKKPDLDRFLHLVTLIIRSAIEHQHIKLHSLKSRIKDYTSFLEKIERKRYKDPFRKCTDLAGCRIVCLFNSQVQKIQEIIGQEFEVIEVTDKKTAKKFDQFGYLSLHMLVRMPKNRVHFIEFSDLDNCICEIQVRTILQEAWAEIEHYLNYKATKQEGHEKLLRKIFSLAGMFEVADATFEEIHNEFNQLIKEHPEPSNNITALKLYKFNQQYFPWYKQEWNKKEERSLFKLTKELKNMNIQSVSNLKKILDKYSLELEKYETYHRQRAKTARTTERFYAPAGLIRAALALEYGRKFDLVFGLKGYADRVKKELAS